jgi:predicted permease
MDAIRELIARILSFFRKAEADADFDAELASHLEMSVQDNVQRGMPAEEARRQALLHLGGMTPARELHRDSRGLPGLDSLLQDLRFGVRMLRRDSTLAAFAILIAGLGVGASSTVFSLFHALLLRPMPFDEPDHLVWIANGNSENRSAQTVQVDNLLELRERSRSFSGIAAYSPFYGDGDTRLTGTGEPERLSRVPVTENFFSLLGVKPKLGRFFTPEECRWQGPRAIILSYRFWERRFGSDPGIAGRAITVDGRPATIVGVLPESFDFAATFAPGTRADIFSPFPLSPETNRQGNTLALIGRLHPSVNLQSVQAEATVIADQMQSERNGQARRNRFQPRLSTLRDRVSGRFRSALLVLAGAVGFLMLLVCANLSNLLLARAAVRLKEMSIRAALGASRLRLIRQMLIESLILSACGAALGLALAMGGTQLLARIERTSIPLLGQVRVDWATGGVTLFVAVLAGILFGLTPALQTSSFALNAALKDSSRGSTGRGWLRGSLVISEIALACVLLTGAGLLMKSLHRVLEVNLGFRTENVFAVRVDPGSVYSTLTQRNAYFDDVLRNAQSVPGVEAVGLTDALPLGDNFGWRTWSVSVKGQIEREGHRRFPLVRMIDDGYLVAMKISLKAGRAFTPADNASGEPVIILNESLARALWPGGEDPLGRIVRTSNVDRRVVGVVGGVRYFALEQDPGSEMYIPLRQTGDYQSVDLVVRGRLAPAALVSPLRAALKRVDPNLPATEFRTMEQLVDHSTFARRSVVLLIGGFAGFGLAIAALGIYGVVSYSVSQRKREIGIRMALGATARKLQAGVLLQTIRLALAGLGIGIFGSWAAARALQGLLFEVTASDPITFATVLLILAAVAILAGYLPAMRASSLNPVDALRCD